MPDGQNRLGHNRTANGETEPIAQEMRRTGFHQTFDIIHERETRYPNYTTKALFYFHALMHPLHTY
jgi:hypothetical protein